MLSLTRPSWICKPTKNATPIKSRTLNKTKNRIWIYVIYKKKNVGPMAFPCGKGSNAATQGNGKMAPQRRSSHNMREYHRRWFNIWRLLGNIQTQNSLLHISLRFFGEISRQVYNKKIRSRWEGRNISSPRWNSIKENASDANYPFITVRFIICSLSTSFKIIQRNLITLLVFSMVKTKKLHRKTYDPLCWINKGISSPRWYSIKENASVANYPFINEIHLLPKK